MTADSHRFNLMCVGDYCSSNICCVFINRIFSNSIDNIFSCIFLIQVGECVVPVSCIVRTECNIRNLITICKQRYCDGGWSDTVSVAIIIPDLIDSNFCLFNSVCISDCIAVNNGIVTGYCIFCYTVSNLFSICILWNISKAVGPVSVFASSDLSGFYFSTVCKQSYCNIFRSDAISVIVICPDLAAIDSDPFRSMCIGDCIGAGCFIFRDFCRIACNCIFLYRIYNRCSTISEFRKSVKRECPFCFSRYYSCICLALIICYRLAIGIKIYRYGCWSDTILVITIIPHFSTGNIDC